MALNSNAIIDTTYWSQVWEGTEVNSERLDALINFASTVFETFCNRRLVERTYTHVVADENEANKIFYKPDYTIFDAPKDSVFWFPTYPVKSITSFSISGTVLSAATSTDYTATDGYILKDREGKLIYTGGFDYNYMQNILVVWKGGYSDDDAEMYALKHLCYLFIKDYINAPPNMTMKSEKIGQYSYATIPSYTLNKLQGFSPFVFNALKKYRREVFA